MVMKAVTTVTTRYRNTRLARSLAFHAGEVLARHRTIVWGQLRSGAPILLTTGDYAHRDILFFGEYETEVTDVFRRIVSDGDVVLDIGANVGYFSLVAADLGADVHAFEPNRRLARMIDRSARMTGASVVVHSVALSDHDGFAPLFLAANKADTAVSSLNPRAERVGPDAVRVEVTTIDNHVERFGLSPTLIKIDVERHEREVLAGAIHTLRAWSPDVIVEISGSPEALRILHNAGYFTWRITTRGLRPLSTLRANDWANVYCSKDEQAVSARQMMAEPGL